MKLKNRTVGGMAVTLVFAVGCSSGGGGTATGGNGGTGGSGQGGSAGTATGGSGGSATGGSATGGSGTGGTAGATGGSAGGGAGGTAGATGGAGGTAGGTSGSGTGGTGGLGGGTGGSPPPPALAVPAGGTLSLSYHGSGVQIYTCTPSAGAGGAGGGGGAAATTYSWVLKGPDAKLYDSSGAQVGTHGIGPEWTSSDGSVVNGTKVEQVNAPVSTPAAIPWLLLRASSTTGTGVFSNVTYVQRLNTTGGVAPATGCDASTSGTDTSVAYTADYYFYTGGGVAAWLTPPANIPSAIAVPSGSTLAIHDHGVGTQIYTCTASGGADAGGDAGAVTYSWVLKGPNAILYDATFANVGTHGVGPEWTSTDGSVINGAKQAQANAPVTTAIPWLLLKATPSGSAGVFSDVTYVQRLDTAGGVAPATGCGAGTVGTETSVAYSADYYFFTGSASDGGTHG
jgi:hypothetical protein